jgi:hypothetical protein
MRKSLALILPGPESGQAKRGDFDYFEWRRRASTRGGSGESANPGLRITYDLGETNPTAEFDYGTQTSTAWDTGTTALTGAMSQTTRTQSGLLDYFTAPAGNQLCLKLGGTSPTAVGV